MQKNHSFTIYNASAGSGKTFTLVKEYLKILFKSNNYDQFKRILAITFTNKAVAEMKERIIEKLKAFSDASVLESSDSMFDTICKELEIAPRTLHTKSKTLLNTIIHNYAAFDISTIDGFTHKLIRTFAHDLKLPLNFEVELEQESLLNEAVDSLIAKAGTDKKLTKTLVDFALEKADDDKSWDLSIDFNKMAKRLVNENDIPFIETLKDKTLEDFKSLKSYLQKQILQTQDNIVETAKTVLNTIENAGLDFNDFTRGTLPNHFKKASELNINGLYSNNLETNITEGKGIYNKSLSPDKATTIDHLLPDIALSFRDIKSQVYYLKFLSSFYKNITPLSVLNAINKELAALKKDQNKILISEFNAIISKEIKNQPTPFIYERLGEKFNNYFIDEFQDTSVTQWENLIPLIDNSLSSGTGNTMLVGDAKQSIYRWRGGKAEQFIDLFNKKAIPFQVEQTIQDLKTNYRSSKEIIRFNNGFFKYLAHTVFQEKTYEDLYEKAFQNTHIENEGYVNINFLDFDKNEDKNVLYPEAVLKTIHACLNQGYRLADLCVLVRKKTEGVAIANHLSQNTIPILSSETLLLNNAPEVNFVNNMLTLLIQPKNKEVKIAVLNFLTDLLKTKNKHDFFSQHINLPLSELFKSFESFQVYIDPDDLLAQPLLDMAETIVREFKLIKTSNAYLQFYLDVVLEFSQKKGTNVSDFLNYFDKKKEQLTIISPEGQNAVQIMTIHKSKGLEFPVVIFPYADLDIYKEQDPMEWVSLDKEQYLGFSHTLLNFNSDFEHYGDEGFRIYQTHRSEQELDNINLLYVTLTRPVEQLYIISKKEMTPKGVVNSNKYSGLLINYLKHIGIWDNTQLSYTFGTANTYTQKSLIKKEVTIQQDFISTKKEKHNVKIVTNVAYLWDTNQREAIEKGNLIHNIMSKILTREDVDSVFKDFINTSNISEEQADILKQLVVKIIEHPKLKDYYSPQYKVYNEQDIISKHGYILRPDRVVINKNNEAIIIDYKTGSEDIKHKQQLQSYQDILESMKLHTTKKMLVYINNDIQVKTL
ncbi:UvrD-helicase domain-containing protein [Snuella sedimenti]|uniref:DNA 3'-5' helicase n=1 Tax=Snuella sedimenti TaxID=2798802 RepID=A0A8J7LRN1_9FLAO|nr:UvrD-helicase domain-containing protein [Snuella sedimenti]MBJ6367365.1 UvrD-helicase domain-containing protein [Snuella sedimenti]